MFTYYNDSPICEQTAKNRQRKLTILTKLTPKTTTKQQQQNNDKKTATENRAERRLRRTEHCVPGYLQDGLNKNKNKNLGGVLKLLSALDLASS